jgi:hypothetical protein
MDYLEKINIGHCRSERKLIKKEKKHLSRVVSTCEFQNYIKWDKSRAVRDGEYCHEMLKLFQKIGGVRNKSSIPGCENYVGCCAEQHAANALVITCPAIGKKYENINFSNARRARTLEIIKPCKNCKMLFNL